MADMLVIGIDVEMPCSNPPFTASMVVDDQLTRQAVFDRFAHEWRDEGFKPAVLIAVYPDLSVHEYRAPDDYDMERPNSGGEEVPNG